MRKLFMSKAMTMLMALALIGAVEAHAQDYDVVLKGGRVMDPETSLDAVMNVGHLAFGGTTRRSDGQPKKGAMR
jgi:N-acyl-D-amino-acid deacylase